MLTPTRQGSHGNTSSSPHSTALLRKPSVKKGQLTPKSSFTNRNSAVSHRHHRLSGPPRAGKNAQRCLGGMRIRRGRCSGLWQRRRSRLVSEFCHEFSFLFFSFQYNLMNFYPFWRGNIVLTLGYYRFIAYTSLVLHTGYQRDAGESVRALIWSFCSNGARVVPCNNWRVAWYLPVSAYYYCLF